MHQRSPSGSGNSSRKRRMTESTRWTRSASHLQISAKTLRLAAESAEIEGIHPLPDGPWLFNRAVLDSSAAKNIVLRARRSARHPTGSDLEQLNLFSSTA